MNIWVRTSSGAMNLAHAIEIGDRDGSATILFVDNKLAETTIPYEELIRAVSCYGSCVDMRGAQ